MKKLFFLFTCCCLGGFSFSQVGKAKGGGMSLGLKAGINFANVTSAASFKSTSKSGFMAGGFLSAGSRLIGYRTELIFSRQGYDYKTGTNNGTVNLDYILLPQLTTISFGKRVQLQVGMHLAYLLNAKADTSSPTGIQQIDDVIKFYNRFDYGIGAGLEIYPAKGLLLGARYNLSLAGLYDTGATGTYPFIPTINKDAFKNNLVQVFAGWRFGK